MKIIADLEIHSKYSRACSPNSDLFHHIKMADKKGIDVLGTGDFTHPEWFTSIKENLEEISAGSGIYKMKGLKTKSNFLLTAELSCIYSKLGKVRRIHVLVFAPTIKSAEKLNKKLLERGAKLASDGRPILGLDIKNLLEIALEIDEKFMIIPAHIWTPWFGFYGSKSGFDSLNDAFEDLTKYVAGIETGLSSDPQMNWRISELDEKAIVSFSDAHSPANLGREATVFDLEDLNYENIFKAIKYGFLKNSKEKNKIFSTIEFYPEEGKYHLDGHKKCGLSFTPDKSKKHNHTCPKCGRKLTLGVLYRVEELADRSDNYVDKNRPDYHKIVPLPEILSEVLGVGKKTKKVLEFYENITNDLGPEFDIILNKSIGDVRKFGGDLLAEAIKRVRTGDIYIEAGYDGEFGKIKIFSPEEKKKAILF